MKLQAFRLYRYRSIVDSGWVPVTSLTVLVGKNESGKTTILKGLHQLNPYWPEPYSIDRDWPRHQRRMRNLDQAVCTARFELSASESEHIRDLSEGQFIVSQVEISRSYRGRLEFSLGDATLDPPLHPNSIDLVVDQLPSVPGLVGEGFKSEAEECLAEVRRLTGEVKLSQLPGIRAQHEIALQACINSWGSAKAVENEQVFLAEYLSKLDEIVARLSSIPPIQAAVCEYLANRMPTFIYMDDYHAFQGSAQLDEVLARKQQSQATGSDRTLEMLLAMAGLTLESEVEKGNGSDREGRQYDLDDAAATLTRAIEGRWNQLKYEVKFAADGHQFFTFVRDQREQSLIKLEERSKGFQWFFSFDLMLMYESQGRFKDCVILLDEPGLSLHPDAQNDLLRRLEFYGTNSTVVYTTHLPFLIDLNHPERIRVLTDTDNGPTVSTNLNDCQPEAKTVLESALAVGASSASLSADRALIVESIEALWLLQELSNLMIRSGRQGLPADALVLPASNAAEAAYQATLMLGRKNDVVLLLSGSKSGNGLAPDVVRQWLDCYQAQVSAEIRSLNGLLEISGRPAEFEEIFEPDFYIEQARQVYARDGNGLPFIFDNPAEPIVKRVERALIDAGILFHRRVVAAHIRTALMRMHSIDELSPATVHRAERVIQSLIEAFNKEKHFWSAGV